MSSSSQSSITALKLQPAAADATRAPPRALHACTLCWLAAWLALSAARQAFDLLGRLWLLVLVDLVQLLAILGGLFALCSARASQRARVPLLRALALFSALAVAHNAALLLWYCTGVLVPDHRHNDWLSFGLPFGHSFFLRYSPLCQAQFNLHTGRWEQLEPCQIPYSLLEGAQAVLHAFMALGALMLSVAVLCCSARKGRRAIVVQEKGSGSRMQHCFVQEQQRVTSAAARASSAELSSGYIDPSCGAYDEAVFPTAPPQIVPHTATRRSYPRAGRRASAKGQNLKRKAQDCASATGAGSVHHEHYSSLSTAGATDTHARRTPALPPASWQGTASSASGGASSSDDNDSRRRQQLTHALTHASSRTPYYTKLGDVNPRYASRINGGALRTFMTPAPDDKDDARVPPESQEPAPDVPPRHDMTRASTRGSDACVNVNNVTALVTIDPKSSTLIRVREHRRRAASSSTCASSSDASGDACNAARQEHVRQPSVPSSPAPALRAAPLRQRVQPPLPHILTQQARLPDVGDCSSNTAMGLQNTENNAFYAAYGSGGDNASLGYGGIRLNNGGTSTMTSETNAAASAPAMSTSASIYEAYVGAARPLALDATACTAFPAHARARRVDCSAASAIRLSRTDLDADVEASTNGASTTTESTMLGMFV